MIDRTDPGQRAEERMERGLRRERRLRSGAAGCALALAAAALGTAGPLTGRDGAWVGAVVLACTLLAVAIAVWPAGLSPAERRHRRLDAIWSETRTDPRADTPWPRFAAWAEATPSGVELWMVERRAGNRPSPYRVTVEARFDPDEIAGAAEAMERLRQEAARRELDARQAHGDAAVAAEHAAQEQQLREVEQRAAGYQREREAQMRRELAEQEASERAAQAQALARALRRP